MPFDKMLVTLGGLAGIASVYWFFLKKEEKEVAISADSTGSLHVEIVVDGGYSPDVISILKGKTTTLTFLRKDPSSCLEEVVLGDFSAEGRSASGGKIRKYLPLNQKVSVEITPQHSGEFGFACGMNMFHGKIIVK